MNIALLLVLATVAVALVVPLVLGIWRLPLRSMVPAALIPTVERVQSRAKPVVASMGSFAGRLGIGLIVVARDGLTALGHLARVITVRGSRMVKARLAWAALGIWVGLSALWAVFIGSLIALVSVVEFGVMHSAVIGFRTTVRTFTAAGRFRNRLGAAGSRAASEAGRVRYRVSTGATSVATATRRFGSGTRRVGRQVRGARSRLRETRWKEETVSPPMDSVAEELPDKRIASSRLLLAVVISASAFAVAVILAFRWLGAAIRNIVS